MPAIQSKIDVAGEAFQHNRAKTRERDLADTIDKFGVIPLSKLLFTKVDECTTFGHIINQLLVSKLPASYFTNGQQIPEDLHPADPEKLAELIVHHQLSSSDQSPNLSDPGFDAHESGMNTYRLRKESYVANKNSTRFHASESKCARRMRAENIVVFKTLTEALNQKFTPCRYCCKGMDKTLSAPHKLAG